MLPQQARRLSQNSDLRALCHLLKSRPSGNWTTISWSPSFWADGRLTGSDPASTAGLGLISRLIGSNHRDRRATIEIVPVVNASEAVVR